MLPAAIGYNLGNLRRFSGRDRRGVFWPYAGFVGVLFVAGTMAALVPAIGKLAAFAQHPVVPDGGANAIGYSASIPGAHPELAAAFTAAIGGIALVMVLTVAALAAAVSRRLHDRGATAYAGFLPLVFLAFGMGAFYRLMSGLAAGIQPNLGLFGALIIDDLLYLGSLIWLAVLLAGPGVRGPNLYGPDPMA